MTTNFDKQAGISLIIFTILLVLTMVLHPVKGNVAYIIQITWIIMAVHAIAILSLPFGWMGFWGLTRKIGTDNGWSVLAFAFISLGLVAVMIAAATNGLIFPIYLQHYKDATPEKLDSLKPILRYGFAINAAFDYIYTFAFAIAIACWSIAILMTKKLNRAIGWMGIFVSIATLIIFISGIAMNSLQGFRIFVTVLVLWILYVGVELVKKRESPTLIVNRES
jgi:hypothetical protein